MSTFLGTHTLFFGHTFFSSSEPGFGEPLWEKMPSSLNKSKFDCMLHRIFCTSLSAGGILLSRLCCTEKKELSKICFYFCPYKLSLSGKASLSPSVYENQGKLQKELFPVLPTQAGITAKFFQQFTRRLVWSFRCTNFLMLSSN